MLTAAGCEGKTTALLQACLDILRNNTSKKILYRTNHTRLFNGTELIDTLNGHSNWLIVIDEADQVAKDVVRFIEGGFNGYEGKIDFLFASRDSDWRSSGASELPWRFRSRYKEVELKDLSLRDAELIVSSWAMYGTKGLGEELFGLPADERADKLRFYAKKESKGGSDAFFGALLMSRHSSDLLEHAESMLNRLSNIELTNGKTLKDALGYIAAMHAEGFNKLNFAALAHIMDMSIPKLQSEVIRRLGKEAAATSTSTTIFTRHKYIALALIQVLETHFDEDISHYYEDLAISELRRSQTEHVLDLGFWRHDLAEQLFITGKSRLAIEIAKTLYDFDSTNYYLVTKLASLYRRQGLSDESVALFRSFKQKVQHRGFYFEWGVCEGIQRHRSENALLACYALSDEIENSPLAVETAKIYLHGLSQCCGQLYVSFADTIFRDAEAACNSLLLILIRNGKSSNEINERMEIFSRDVAKKRVNVLERQEAIKTIMHMASRIKAYDPSKDVTDTLSVKTLSFMSLDRILKNIEGISDTINH